MRTVDFNRLSSQLKRTRAQYPTRITRAQFSMSLKGILNTPESNRLFDYYLHRDVIGAISKTCYIFRQHQEYFSVQSLVEIFEKNDIQTKKYCFFRDATPEQKEALNEKKLAGIARKKLAEPVQQVATKALSQFSDEELQAELNRRIEIHKQKERLSTILSVAEISLDELKSLIQLVG